MNKRRVAVVTIGDTRKEFFEKRRNIVNEENAKLKSVLSSRYETYFPDIVFSYKKAREVSEEIIKQGINAVIIHLPIWGTPALAATVSFATKLPVMLLGNLRFDSSSLVTLLAVAGMVEQEGKECIRVSGDIKDFAVVKDIFDYIDAANLYKEISNSHFGLIGGRSIGIGTTVFDPSMWQKLFGVSMDHRDQYEIVYRAKDIDSERVKRHKAWMVKNFRFEYGGRFTEDSFDKQVRSYLALKDMVDEGEFDFLGIKCQTDMSDHYALQCVAVGLLNNNVDADGVKKPIPTSCECDADGALTMRLLQLCGDGKPTNLSDIKFFDKEKKEFILANCGSFAPYFANPSEYEKALNKVTLMEHTFGEAGGCAMQMIASQGDVTVARLFRKDGKYIMGFFEGKLEIRDIEELRKTAWCYPHEFVKADIDYDKFYQTMNSNHIHTVYGKYSGMLKSYCKMAGIDYYCYND